jgi:hypothetical protein
MWSKPIQHQYSSSIRGMGHGDIVSGGCSECCARRPRRKSDFRGVGKTADKSAPLLMRNFFFNVESPAELDLIHSIARDSGRQAPV